MYAIVEMAGQQFKVAKDQKVYVHRLQTEEGKKVTFGNVLLTGDGSDITIGAPAIDGASVEAKVIRHLRGDKVIVFKKKRRKGYQKKNGHRQSLTEIVIESIVLKGGKKADKKAEVKEDKPVAKKDTKVKVAATEKAAPAKKETATKPKVEKAATKKASPKKDDLKKIEGIGPKTAEALVAADIDTFDKLAKTDAKKIKEILVEASSSLSHLDAGTWPAQAQMAADGKWDELKKWQDELNGGK